MQDDVAMSTAARELGLGPGEMTLAAQLGHVRTVHAAPSATRVGAQREPARRRVPRAELRRLRAAEDFPDGLRARLRVLDARGGARLLGIPAPRFGRLARGGCFSPVRFYVNRYGTVVWLYLAQELTSVAETRPELLAGNLPHGLRRVLAEGVDLRAGHWRGRRVGQLCREAEGPWEAAAARAAVLREELLREAVPDVDERARLFALRPELMPLRGRSPAVRKVTEELCTASSENEIFWQRLMLDADLENARAAEPLTPGGRPAHPADPADGGTGQAHTAGERDGRRAGGAPTCARRPFTRAVHGPGRAPRTGDDANHGRAQAGQRARVPATPRAPRQGPRRWSGAAAAGPGGLSRPAF